MRCQRVGEENAGKREQRHLQQRVRRDDEIGKPAHEADLRMPINRAMPAIGMRAVSASIRIGRSGCNAMNSSSIAAIDNHVMRSESRA
jgi:hypothetical protein